MYHSRVEWSGNGNSDWNCVNRERWFFEKRFFFLNIEGDEFPDMGDEDVKRGKKRFHSDNTISAGHSTSPILRSSKFKFACERDSIPTTQYSRAFNLTYPRSSKSKIPTNPKNPHLQLFSWREFETTFVKSADKIPTLKPIKKKKKITDSKHMIDLSFSPFC